MKSQVKETMENGMELGFKSEGVWGLRFWGFGLRGKLSGVW